MKKLMYFIALLSTFSSTSLILAADKNEGRYLGLMMFLDDLISDEEKKKKKSAYKPVLQYLNRKVQKGITFHEYKQGGDLDAVRCLVLDYKTLNLDKNTTFKEIKTLLRENFKNNKYKITSVQFYNRKKAGEHFCLPTDDFLDKKPDLSLTKEETFQNSKQTKYGIGFNTRFNEDPQFLSLDDDSTDSDSESIDSEKGHENEDEQKKPIDNNDTKTNGSAFWLIPIGLSTAVLLTIYYFVDKDKKKKKTPNDNKV